MGDYLFRYGHRIYENVQRDAGLFLFPSYESAL